MNTQTAERPSSTRESRWRRLRRRLVTVPAIGVGFAVVSTLAPALLVVAAVVDLARPGPVHEGTGEGGEALPKTFVTTRLVAEAWAFLAIECVGLAMLAWAGLTTMTSPEKREARTFAVQRIYTGMQWRAAAALFDLRLDIENPEALAPAGEGSRRPVLVLLRHASLVDVLLPAVLLANRHTIALRYVLKRELLVEPCIDIAGNWLPNCFVSRDGTDSPTEIARVRALGRDLHEGEGVLVYPEGTRFTEGKRRRILERLRGEDDPSAFEAASRLRHLLPVRAGGCLALLDAAAGCDVLFVGHDGLEGFATLQDIWRRQMVRRRVRVKIWREAASSIPTDEASRLGWLTDRWQRLDDWLHQER